MWLYNFGIPYGAHIIFQLDSSGPAGALISYPPNGKVQACDFFLWLVRAALRKGTEDGAENEFPLSPHHGPNFHLNGNSHQR